MLRRLESAIRDNSTMKELMLRDLILFQTYSTPIVHASVAGAILKGTAHNKRLESMSMGVPNELQELVDAVKQENKKLRLDVEYYKVGVSLYCLVCQCPLLWLVRNCL